VKKPLYLFLALLLPGLIFVFLKYAGRNEFSIPLYYQEGVENIPRDCGISYPKPYRIPDSIMESLHVKPGLPNVLVFPSLGLDTDRLQSVLEGEFEDGVGLQQVCLLAPDSATCLQWKKCIFLINDPAQALLIDQESRIRGYYDVRNRDEEDRLRVELKILLKKY
jgi:protein SCO1/2